MLILLIYKKHLQFKQSNSSAELLMQEIGTMVRAEVGFDTTYNYNFRLLEWVIICHFHIYMNR